MELLPSTAYSTVIPLLRVVPFYTGFAESVLLHQTPGVVYVNCHAPDVAPQVAYIIMKFGMSVLCGSMKDLASSYSDEYCKELVSWLMIHLKQRKVSAPFEFMQASPVLEWKDILQGRLLTENESFDSWFTGPQVPDEMPGEPPKFMLMERVVYRYPTCVCVTDTNCGTIADASNAALSSVPLAISDPVLPTGYSVVPLAVPKHFFLSSQFHIGPDTFFASPKAWKEAGGIGYVALYEDQVVALAFSAIRLSTTTNSYSNYSDNDDNCDRINIAEIGVETSALHRGKGLAKAVCSQMVRRCVANNIEPVWCCRRGNIGSEHLAESLGFQEQKFDFGRICYYRLPVV